MTFSAIFPGILRAQENSINSFRNTNPKPDNGEALQNLNLERQGNASPFRIERGFQTNIFAEIFFGYEHFDIGESSINLENQSSGFQIDSVSFEIMSQYLGGSLKGLILDLALDLTSASNLRDGCQANSSSSGNTGSTAMATEGCSQNNDYLVILKFAYVQFPLNIPSLSGTTSGKGKHWVILGQQPTPIVKEFANYWTEAHTTDDIFQTIGYSPETDRGIGYLYESQQTLVHLLLSNGEGGSFLNADPSAPQPRSQGLGLQGLIRVRPDLPPESMTTFSLLLPFQIDSFLRFRGQTLPINPVERAQTPDLTQVRSYSYGLSTDLTIDDGLNRWSAQIGSYFLEVPAFRPINAAQTTPKSFGRMDFFQTSYKYAFWAVFYRYYQTTSLFDNAGSLEALPTGSPEGKSTRNLWGMSFFLRPPWEFFVMSLGSDTIISTFLPSAEATKTVSQRTVELFFRMGMSWEFNLE